MTVLPARAALDSRTLKVTATAKTVPCSRILLHSSKNQRTSLHNSFKSGRNESAWVHCPPEARPYRPGEGAHFRRLHVQVVVARNDCKIELLYQTNIKKKQIRIVQVKVPILDGCTLRYSLRK